jgi:thioredoxin 1
MSGQNTLTLTDGSWETDVLKSNVPVLVDFWAEWCGPCRMVGPTVESIADEFQGKLKVGKLNVDDNGDTAMRYQVRGIPMFLLFKDGRVVEQKVGAMGKADFVKMITPHLPATAAAEPLQPKPVETVGAVAEPRVAATAEKR